MDDYHLRGFERRDYRPRVRLATPEGVEVELELAGVGTRGAATAIDLLLLVAFVGLLLLAGAAGFGLGADIGGVALSIVGSAVTLFVLVGYDVLCELAFDGRTAGKAAVGLRVVRTDGRRVDALASLARNATRLLEVPLAYLPAILCVWLTPRAQRFGDLVGGTLVVRQPRGRAAAGTLSSSADADLVRAVRTDARLAERAASLDVTALRHEDLALARSYLLRADGLDDARRADIAADLAAGYRGRLGVGTEGLSDHDLLRVVVAASARGG